MPPHGFSSLRLPGQYHSATHISTDLFSHTPPSHRVPPPRFLIHPVTYQHHAHQFRHTRNNNFFPYMAFEYGHNIRN